MPRPQILILLALGCLGIAALAAAPALDGRSAAGEASKRPASSAPTSADPQREAAEDGEPVEPEAIEWRQSASLGTPTAGALRRGVRLPAEGEEFFTWDPHLKRAPNRPWRRWASDDTVRVLLRVLREFRAVHPEAPRIGVGDLSRPKGGDFGPRFGLPGHASHRNGLDIDLYYPRRDSRERAPTRVGQVDLALSQDLVSRFVRVGAVYVFVGPNTDLRGPASVVQPLPHHDNHLHVRLPPNSPE